MTISSVAPATSRPVPSRAARPAVPALAPAGPVWFSSVMGTGILATLVGRESADVPALLVPASLLLGVGCLLLLGLSAGFVARVIQDRDAFTATIRDSTVVPTWGTVSMAVLSVGAAVLTLVPQLGARTSSGDPAGWVVGVDAGCWALGTALGVVTAFGFAAVLVKRDVGHPSPAWGLPIVPPMVSATAGAALVPHLGTPAARLIMLVGIVACFFLSLFLGGLVFAIAYHHHWRTLALPVTASFSSWIPLGVVGQSVAATQVMVAQSAPLLTPAAAEAARQLADAYGYVMLATSIPVIVYAVRMSVRGVRARIAFAPGWWALTFPIGTLALGTRLLGASTANPVIGAVGVVAIVTLCGTWLLCAGASVRAVVSTRPDPAPGT